MGSPGIDPLLSAVRRIEELVAEGDPVRSESRGTLAAAAQDLGAVANEVTQVSRVLRLRASLSRNLRDAGLAGVLGDVCRAMVEEAGYAGAWIGITDDRPGALWPLATAGLSASLADVVIVPSEDDGTAAPPDPVAEALRRRQPAVSLIRHGEPLPAWASPYLAADGGACGVLPLELNGRPGVLVLVSAASDAFCEGEIDALSALAADMTAALRWPVSHSDADGREGDDRWRADDLALLNALNHASNRGADLPELLAVLCARVRALFGANGASAYLMSDDRRSLVLQNSPLSPEMQRRVEVMIGLRLPTVRIPLEQGGVYEGIIRAGRPQLITDQPTIQRLMAECTTSRFLRRFVPAISKLLGYGCVLSVPMVAEGATIGLVDVGRATAFDAREVERFVVIAEQLTALVHRRLTQGVLRSSEERMRSLFEGIPTALFRVFSDGVVIDANPALLAVFGYSTREELLTQNALDFFVDAEDRERCRSLLANEGHVSGLEARMRRQDGSVIWARLNIRAARQGDTVWWEGSLEDITESRLLARRLQESRRLESVGRLAGGIAHEYNNLLQVILGHTDLLLVKVPVEDPRRSGLMQIRDAGMRAHSLVRQLVAFGRRQILDTRPTDLNGLIIHQESILRSLLGERVKVALELEPVLRPALVDPCQIEQVVATLCLNGRDAMAEGGTLTIRTWNVPHGGDDSLRDPKAKEGGFVGLAVADTGDGMSPETLDRIFEPFFTTKDPVNGAGLGLAVVHGVVTQHGGWLNVTSVPGRGSEFRVFLPVCSGAAETSRAKPAEPPGPTGNAQCILVVEDDEVIRGMAAEALRENGYQVLEAATREEAMAQYAAHEEVIDLLFADVVLSDGSGIDLVSRILAIRPELRVLLTSGYMERVSEGTIEGRLLPFISKPYCIDELFRAVHRALHARVQAGG